ncbi:protein-S-isoprenylcysteine O-methyltransferase Ste14 [Rhizobium leguminosarum]|uniref:Protein-S-isoprenylcysteine O-methyltransferase Ste14 n=1 Tax=Rhizobium leguminosarum TaxID=384 RepID=A0AAE2SW83_RHILE|nr:MULTISPECIES: isoprenylcysteine carboxylmethyltransferase family protein [Rhizobium]MBB4290245.1 protein-S-isoprenylcysteine O-methyltransferase Ste14 [Rhizobium leguminosarum]MBB4296888.1 protein-S-isoprenylcysteine O-methyltransferase Ste14 [Rhizobium leguminosarum]MBB4307850.1 protein-S-isoprenylcysteine O-methyltransferase Ste14 [Rhizobium leguminosarum]MBB4415686.1 protein-S-isoprenylcysteine O-methyltransferase Ste14 [Rhizobium leguminosarum]MBB4431348.1 protein-S-isoprenylcysteine O-
MKKKTTASWSFFDVYFVLDIIEKVVIGYFFVAIVLRILPQMQDNRAIIDFLLIVSEGAAAFLILTRRPTKNASLRVFDWMVTAIGTLFPLLVVPSATQPLAPLALCGTVMALGFVLQISAKLSLRRSFGLVPANRGIKIGGPYKFVRHPMYAGYLMTHIGFFLAHPSLWNFAIYATALTAQCFRLLAEERLLSQDPAYQAFMGRTRYRLVPFLF